MSFKNTQSFSALLIQYKKKSRIPRLKEFMKTLHLNLRDPWNDLKCRGTQWKDTYITKVNLESKESIQRQDRLQPLLRQQGEIHYLGEVWAPRPTGFVRTCSVCQEDRATGFQLLWQDAGCKQGLLGPPNNSRKWWCQLCSQTVRSEGWRDGSTSYGDEKAPWPESNLQNVRNGGGDSALTFTYLPWHPCTRHTHQWE